MGYIYIDTLLILTAFHLTNYIEIDNFFLLENFTGILMFIYEHLSYLIYVWFLMQVNFKWRSVLTFKCIEQ